MLGARRRSRLRSVITLPPVDDPQKENEELIFSLIKTKTHRNPLYFWLRRVLLWRKLPQGLSGWGQQAFIFLAKGSASQPWRELRWPPGLGSDAVPRGSVSWPRMKGQRLPEPACLAEGVPRSRGQVKIGEHNRSVSGQLILPWVRQV